MGKVTKLLDNASGFASSPQLRSDQPKGLQGISQFARVSGAGTFTVTVEGRVSDAAPWGVLAVLTEVDLDSNDTLIVEHALTNNLRHNFAIQGGTSAISSWQDE